MHRFSTARSAVAFTVAVVSLAAPAVAGAENCPDTSFIALAAADCRGAFVGTLSGSAAETAALGSHFGGAWSYLGKRSDAGNGPFSTHPLSAFGGVLTFDTPASGDFVLGLEAAGQTSFYRFHGGPGVASLTFDTTEGVATTIQGNPQNLSDAALYVAVVPEPGVPALFTAGLLALAWRARRRARYPIPSCDQ